MSRTRQLLVALVVTGVIWALSLLAAGLWLAFADEEYETSAKVYLSVTDPRDTDPYASSWPMSRAELDHCAEVARSRPVATAVSYALGPEDPAALRDQIRVTPVPETLLLEVTARESSATGAQLLAYAWAQETAKQLTGTPSTCVKDPALEVLATVTDPPPLPSDPVSPDPARTFLVAGPTGLIVGAALGGLTAVVLRRRQ